MNKIITSIDPYTFSRIEQYVHEGWISKRTHPLDPLLCIYNYTPKTQYEWFWDDITKMCRGLILYESPYDTRPQIVSRPFPKFFNMEELDGKYPRNTNFEAYEKMDGSLGILYHHSKIPCIATRGSFESEQAIKGTEMLRKHVAKTPGLIFSQTLTYLFEIIYPENRIIVNYGSKEELVLLAIIDTATGKGLDVDEHRDIGFTKARRSSSTDLNSFVNNYNTANREGVVIYWPAENFRMKIKYEEYKKIARFMSGIGRKKIWETLKEGKKITDDVQLLEYIPDEFFQGIKTAEQLFLDQFRDIEVECRAYYKEIMSKPELHRMETMSVDRRGVAKYFAAHHYQGVLFKLLDGKPIDETIWKIIKPKGDVSILDTSTKTCEGMVTN